MKTTTTQKTALTDTERTAHRRHEIKQAFNDELYEQAEKAVYIALRARHEKSGLQFLADLQNAQTSDKQARNNIRIAEQMTNHEKTLEELRNDYNNLLKLRSMAERQAVNMKNSDELRRAWAEHVHELTATINHYKNDIQHHQSIINDLFDQLQINLSDRADLTQTAIIKMLELEQEPAPITKNVLSVYGVETAEELTDTERADAQQTANFRAVINSVGRAINQLASPEALNRTTTTAEPITAEEVTEYIKMYGNIGKDLKIPVSRKRTRASDCYMTIEERHTKIQNGYFRIMHYKTTAPYQYIENYTEDENGETDAQYLKTYNPFISNYSDIEKIEELCENANLTDRQKLFLEHFARRCRLENDFQKCKNYAFSQIGITTETNKTTFFNRLKKALNK